MEKLVKLMFILECLRNMLEGSAAEQFSREETRDPESIPPPTRWPMAWLLLKPLPQSQSRFEQDGGSLLVLPLRIDVGLPDYLTSRADFEQSMSLRWEVGQRFQMFFGGKSKSKGKPGKRVNPDELYPHEALAWMYEELHAEFHSIHHLCRSLSFHYWLHFCPVVAQMGKLCCLQSIVRSHLVILLLSSGNFIDIAMDTKVHRRKEFVCLQLAFITEAQ